MLKSKLFKFLTVLSPEELKGLGRFLGSPHFNTDPNLEQLYAALAERAPNFADERMDKQQLFAEVFPDTGWDDDKWRNLASKFVKSLEQYFVQLELDELTHRRILAQALSRRNLFRYYEKEQRALIGELEARPVLELENLRKAMLMKRELNQHPLSLSADKGQEIAELRRDLDLFYEIEKIRLDCDHLHLLRYRGQEAVPTSKRYTSEPALLQMHRLIYGLLSNGTEQDFEEAKDFLMENMDRLGIEDQKIGLLSLQNYAIRQLNTGKAHFNRSVFDLYQLGLRQKILLENGLLTRATFLNIVSTGLQVQEFEWVWEFIHSHAQYLPPETQVTTKTRAIAEFYFQKGAYEQVIDILANFSSIDTNDVVAARTLVLRSYFEKFLVDDSYYDLFRYYADSFLKLVGRRGLLAKAHKEAFSKFIRILRKVAKSKSDQKWTKEVKAHYLTSIQQTQNLTAKSWLLKKVEAM